jgi:oligoribonuclease (3'-5' exoribonuclease)
MPYIALDLETTGLDVDNHQILEIGAVFNDFNRPIIACDVFCRTIHPRGDIVGNPYALAMNAALLQRIADGEGVDIDAACKDFRQWLEINGITSKNKATLVGKNVGSFDWQFLRHELDFPVELIDYRILDIGSMYATPYGIRGQAELCAATAKQHDIPGAEHTAVFDARVSLALARDKWSNENGGIEWRELGFITGATPAEEITGP